LTFCAWEKAVKREVRSSFCLFLCKNEACDGVCTRASHQDLVFHGDCSVGHYSKRLLARWVFCFRLYKNNFLHTKFTIFTTNLNVLVSCVLMLLTLFDAVLRSVVLILYIISSIHLRIGVQLEGRTQE
jgi:hypothetical protein